MSDQCPYAAPTNKCKCVELGTLRAKVEKLENTSHFCAHERPMETCELFEQLTELEEAQWYLPPSVAHDGVGKTWTTYAQEEFKKRQELEQANKNANEMIGANSDELGTIIEKQSAKIIELEQAGMAVMLGIAKQNIPTVELTYELAGAIAAWRKLMEASDE